MSFSMLFCIVFTMGAVFFDCKWEKVPNLWIIAGLQISMTEHLSGEVTQGLGSAVIRFWGGIFLVLFLFFPLFLGNRRYQGAGGTRQCTGPPENTVLHRDGISSGCRGIFFSSFLSL